MSYTHHVKGWIVGVGQKKGMRRGGEYESRQDDNLWVESKKQKGWGEDWMGQRELHFLYSGPLAGNSLFLVITPENK